MDKGERNNLLGVLIAIVVILGGFWAFQKITKNDNPQADIVASVGEFKKISHKEAIALAKNPTARQMVYIGCRDCGHCKTLETAIGKFLGKYPEANQNKDLIVMVEAGYTCVPGDKNSQEFKDYLELAKLYVADADPETGSFGTPQVLFVENGKVVDAGLTARSVEGLEDLFKSKGYDLTKPSGKSAQVESDDQAKPTESPEPEAATKDGKPEELPATSGR